MLLELNFLQHKSRTSTNKKQTYGAALALVFIICKWSIFLREHGQLRTNIQFSYYNPIQFLK